MNSGDLAVNRSVRTCANCKKPADESVLKHMDYRCPECGFEMAHVDVAPNGSIRGVFGYLKAVGEVIQDRYQVEKVLGRGGFGATYLVEDLRLKGKRRALKEVPELLFDEHEVDVLSQLRHPAIPDITDRFVSEGMIYLVLEFGGRRTLGTQCQSLGGRIPLFTALPWMRQLCDALTYLHSQNPPIVHRDLKPENVLLDDRDFIMLIDFGIAKASAPATTTRVMARAASHGFSPPEQVVGTGTDERSDIYAFGATFYYLLTGQIPAAAHERIAGREIEAPSTLVAGLPPELDEILLSTLNLNINQRPSTVEDVRLMLDTLESVAAPEFPQASRTVRVGPGTGRVATAPPGTALQGIRIATAEPIPPKTGTVQGEAKKPSVALMLAIVIAIVTALATGAYFFLSPKSTSPVQQAVANPEPQQPPTQQPSSDQAAADLPAQPSVGEASGLPAVAPTPLAVAPSAEERGPQTATASVHGIAPQPSIPAGLQPSPQPAPPPSMSSQQPLPASGSAGGSALDILQQRRGTEASPPEESVSAPNGGGGEAAKPKTRSSGSRRATRPPPSRNF
jgi:eukaryotic-like serine/threonine-protein kinase